MYVYLRSKFQISSIIQHLLDPPPPVLNEPSKKTTQTIFLCISLSVDGQLVELTY